MNPKLLVVGLAGISIVACDERPDQWDALVYADAKNLDAVEINRGFKYFELCQQAAIERLRSKPNPDGDYFCGYMCGPNGNYGGRHICKETEK